MSSLSLRRGGRRGAGIAALTASRSCVAPRMRRQTRAARRGLHQRRRHEHARARGRRVGHRRDDGAQDAVHQDRRDRRRRPLRAAAAARRRRTTSGCAAMVSPIPIASKGGPATRRSNSRRRSRARRPRPRRSIPATTGSRCSSRRRESEFPGTGDERQRHSARDGDAGSLDLQHQEPAATSATSSATRSRARSATWITWASRRPRRRGSIARSSACAAARWPARWRSGGLQAGAQRDGRLDDAHRERRAAAAPPRPRPGVERNVVVTLWDWGVDTSFMHDEITTDKNDPTVNGYGPVYAVSAGPRQAHRRSTRSRTTRYEITIPTREDPRKCQLAVPAAGDAVELLGHAAPMGSREPGRSAQPDDGPQGPRLDDVEDPQRGAGVVPRRLEPQVRAVLSAQLQQPSGVVLRPGDRRVPAHRHVLRDASPAVRQRRRSDAVLQRAARARSSVGSTRASTTARATSRRRKAGARKSSTRTATARSRSRGTCPGSPPIRAATPRCGTTSTR